MKQVPNIEKNNFPPYPQRKRYSTYWNQGYGYQQGYGPGYGSSDDSPHGYYGYGPGYYYSTYWNQGYGYQQGYGPGYGSSDDSPHGYYGYGPGYYYRSLSWIEGVWGCITGLGPTAVLGVDTANLMCQFHDTIILLPIPGIKLSEVCAGHTDGSNNGGIRPAPEHLTCFDLASVPVFTCRQRHLRGLNPDELKGLRILPEAIIPA
ncbi:Tripartite Motif-Containing Protein 6 [Manis pentadactyla]|nr:Tripartite Motif-Containing Protein 6 [Manis pentadactyla]